MRSTYSVTAQLRMDKLRADGKAAPLYWFPRVGAHVKKIPTGKFLAPEDWDKKNKCPKTNTKHGKALKNWLNHKIDGFYTAMLEYERMDKVVTSIVAAAYFDDNCEITLFGFWEKQMSEMEKNGYSVNTLKSYKSVLKILKEFNANLNFYDVSLKMIKDFDSYLRDQRANALNGRFVKHKCLKKILNVALDEEYIKVNPYSKFPIRADKVVRDSLNIQEVKHLLNFDLSSESLMLNMVRDIFLFSCFTNLRYSDVMALKMENMKLSDGPPRLEIKVAKTKRFLVVPLSLLARNLIDKYNSKDSKQLHDEIFPQIANPVINRNLKTLMEIVGIKKHISFHCSRHSFGVNHVEAGTDLIYIKELMGHKDIEQTQIYARATDLSLFKSMSHLETMYQ
jgi:integrase/recombinase XerD